MRCFEIDLGKMLKIALWNKTEYSAPQRHPTRITPSAIMYFIMEGSLKIESDGRKYEFFAGDVAIFPKGVVQRPIEDSSVRYYFIHFNDDPLTMRDFDEDEYASALLDLRKSRLELSHVCEKLTYDSIGILLKEHFSLPKEFMDKIAVSLDEISELLMRRTPRNLLKASFTLSDILYLLEEYSGVDKTLRIEGTQNFTAVTKAARIIARSYTSDISVSHIAAELYLNPDYLGRIFKRHVGCSMVKYKNRLRIAAAKRMLISTASSIDEIAFATGFSDRFYFSRIFKSIEGITPNEYRRNAYGINTEDYEI